MSTAVLSIFRNPLRSCVILRLLCERCGFVRLLVEDAPRAPMIGCPHCGTESVFEQIAVGQTTRYLPHYRLEAWDVNAINQPGAHLNSRPAIQIGSIVVLVQDVDCMLQAEVTEVWTNEPSGAGSLPALRFRIGPDMTEPIAHRSKTGIMPYWCFADELAVKRMIPLPVSQPQSRSKKSKHAAKSVISSITRSKP